MKKNIIITGYPKSGNTWLTRLTAEIVGCPVEGFWGEPEGIEIAVEGEGRISPFRCYKGHHQIHELDTHSEKSYTSVIYIVRDPRDVVVSGSRYFYPPRFGLIGRAARSLSWVGNAYKNVFNTRNYRIDRMKEAVLKGDRGVNHWCRVSWDAHVAGYLHSNHHVVTYEDLLDDPIQVCKGIVGHLGLDRSEERLEECVRQQSMEAKKKKFIERGEEEKAQFMKSGTHGQWRSVLSQSDVSSIEQEFGCLLNFLGYELATL